MSLAKLTTVSTKTLSLLLERQRLQSLPSFSETPSTNSVSNGTSLHFPQIKRNMIRLREGILELEGKEGQSEAARLLRKQYDRMRGMLGVEEQSQIPKVEPETSSASTSADIPNPNTLPTTTIGRDALLSQPSFAPYTDDPEQGLGVEPPEPATMLQTQRLLMDEQDQHLDLLSNSITRQHHISLQINEELDVHSGLLEELDTQLDRTEGRLGRARKSLDKVARGVKNNGSVVAIGLLIFVLLILIIRFKT
ncbi:hypothetical protein BYT27DRAFT_7231676 [Phlegmacium glaucopus]|nr:hypothetical protein BYT27DRAFT_7231676 [Phlegmacium glaucopus]